jgi:putative FmdB family regulatory protein
MTYNYICEKCKSEWEEEQSIKDEPITNCPYCEENTAKRLIGGGTGFILQGGCWGKDNYSKK